jgi:glycosyltransferase involved in cell wall biosynthesis
MNIVFFINPNFGNSLQHTKFSGLSKYTKMLIEGMSARGHQVKIWTPKSRFHNVPAGGFLKKWMGYIDQYLVFPAEVRSYLKEAPEDTLFVFTDQAQGMWVPLVSNRHHVIHCHDFMALLSATDEVPENKISWSGKQHQRNIRTGISRGQNFISVSKNTATELARNIPATPASSNIVYNGLNKTFEPYDAAKSRILFGNKVKRSLENGYILHVGGNQWYKNRNGVVEIYNAWRRIYNVKKPLLLIGDEPSAALAATISKSPYHNDIIVCTNLEDYELGMAYAGATVFLFPSLSEGFGWPIAEAMAAGCQVITTNEAPMTEVGGKAATFIPRRPIEKTLSTAWASSAAVVLNRIMTNSVPERNVAVQASIENAKRFNAVHALDQIEDIYRNLIAAPTSNDKK